ncbi:MAG: ATP-binding protein [Thermincola sp.]|nr:ATP-binding protein [Thermincola sp.]MDT3702274.1 ATP-binding protein [Thermincola sp.]
MGLWRNSLPLRLAITTGGIFACVLITIVIAAYATTAHLLQNGTDSALRTLAQSTAAVWPADNRVDGGHEKSDEDDENDEDNLPLVQVVDSSGNSIYRSNEHQAMPVDQELLRQALHKGEAFTYAIREHDRLAGQNLPAWLSPLWPGQDGVRIMYVPFSGGGNESRAGILQLGLPVKENASLLLSLGKIMLIISLAALALVSAISVLLAWRAFRPLRRITAIAEEIDGNTLTTRIQVDVTDKTLSRLVQVLNAMLKRLESAFAAQARFVNDAAHDLRTPLSALRSELEVTLRQTRSEVAYVETLKSCLGEVEHLGSLTNNLLTMAKFDSGLRLEMEPALPLAVLLQRVNRELGSLAVQNEVAVTLEVEKDLSLDCNPLALERLFGNLIHNSLRYTPAGGTVELCARAKLNPGGGAGVEITVTDTGIGISSKDLPYIFDRFYRADSARSRDQGGSGLGLSICRSIVESHAGTIAIISEQHKGTCVRVWLPCKQ